MGGFTQPDPIGLAGGLNLYGYAGGDPVNFSDPFGLCPACWVVGGALLHWGRNLFNRGQELASPQQADSAGYTSRPAEKSVFHTQGDGNTGNTVWTKGGHEVVFDANGKVVNDDLNGGTFNYCPQNDLVHGICDVVPYLLLGNSPRDALRIGSRIKRAVGGGNP